MSFWKKAAIMRGFMPFSSEILNGLALIYGALVKTRNALYDAGVLKAYRAPLLVVSVGNIEAGGTGKTPFTMALADELFHRGRHVAIVTRGYKGRLAGPIIVTPQHQTEDAGDEALLMARLMKVPVIKSPDRLKGALFAYVHLGTEIIILDDGFQHRRLHRDMDIVLVGRDITRERLLPAGHLREPASSLSRADIIIAFKGADHDGLKAELKPSELVDPHGKTSDLRLLTGKRILAFCAIGRPDHFFAMLEGLGAVVERLAYRDHHSYTATDVKEIMDRAAGRDLILTTEKDLVKIDTAWFTAESDRVYAVRVGIDMPGLAGITDEIERKADNCRFPGQG
jgi:tetraacyldisaccharide 4'-kinase